MKKWTAFLVACVLGCSSMNLQAQGDSTNRDMMTMGVVAVLAIGGGLLSWALTSPTSPEQHTVPAINVHAHNG